MNRKITYFILLCFSIQATFAGKVHTLSEGESISKILLNESYIPNYTHTKGIKSILDENKLSWETAKLLPVGFSFTVEYFEGSDTPIIVPVEASKEVFRSAQANQIQRSLKYGSYTSKKFGKKNLIIGGGSFYNHSKLLNKNQARSIYSKMSQFVSATYILKKNRKNFRRVGIDFYNYLYENDADLGVKTSTNRNSINVWGEFRYNYSDKLSAGLGGTAKSLSYFDINSRDITKFKTAGLASLTSNIEYVLRSRKFWDFNIGLTHHRGLYSDRLSNQTLNEVYVYSDISLMKRILRLKLNYSENNFNVNNDNYSDRNIGVGAQYQIKI